MKHILIQREVNDMSMKVKNFQELLEKEKEAKKQMEAQCRRLENNLMSEKVCIPNPMLCYTYLHKY